MNTMQVTRPASSTILDRSSFDQLMVPNYMPSNIIPVRGQGSRLWDQDDREYIDLAGGIAVSALGHCHPKVVEALVSQAHKIWQLSNVMANEPALRLAQRLVEATFAEKIFFCNSGGEANEAALKLARKYAKDHYDREKIEIVAALNSFHGRTLFTVTVGGQEKYTKGFEPLPTGITHVPYNDIEALTAATTDRTCAIILEPLQGEGGVTSATSAYLKSARELCDKTGALLIFDEVQSGNGRTGALYNYMKKGVQPDILTTAKGLGGGFPIGAMLTTAAIATSFNVGSHGSTYGGNALGCAIAEAVLAEIMKPELLRGVQHRHDLLTQALRELAVTTQAFSQVRGEGLLIGCELANDFKGKAKEFIRAGERQGVLFLQAGLDVLRLAPSLIIPEEDLMEGVRRLALAVTSITKS